MKFNDNTALAIEEHEYSDSYSSNRNRVNPNKNKHKQPKKNSSVGVVISALIVTALLFIMIYGKVQVSALFTEISSEKEVVDLLESENVRMQSEIESNMSLRNVESYAENVLGLKKLDKSQIVYIQIQNEDVVQVVETEDNIFVNIKEKFNDIVEYLFG
jgi:cell division protein FtsL